MPALAKDSLPDLMITAIKPYHYEWYEEYDIPKGEPWFNLKNYVNVTVKNNGTAAAGSFKVKLYADGELIGSETVDELSADSPDNTTDVKFEWVPEGEDPLSWTDTDEGAICTYTDTSVEYTLKAVVDEDNEVNEGDNEDNNEFTKPEPQKVVWNGYMADEPLKDYVHDEVEGGIIYTTGDGEYRGRFTDGTEYDTYYDVNYDLKIQGDVKLARLYIYHTWSKPDYTAPKIGVTLKTPSDDVHELNMEKSYNDIKGDFGAWRYVWGTYAYNITEYVKESGAYIVSVTNLNSGSDDDFATEFAFAAPAILVVYEDTGMPKREYWINEGADILMGGRRGDGGFLSLEECLNSATFDGEHLDLEVEKATLAVVSPWGDDKENVLYFNDEELGEGLYCGYHDPCSSDEDIEGISMIIGGIEAQVGIAAFDVTGDLEDYDNEVIQGDDEDNMMPVNAFLVITYEEEEGAEEQNPPNVTPQEPVDTEINNIEGESRTFSVSIDQSVDIVWQLNGTEVQTDEGVTEATYTNASAVLGTWNVSAIGTNSETGLSGMHTWIWNVTAAVGTTPTSAVNITSTPSPTPTLTATPTSSVSATPTPTPTPTTATPRPGEKKKAEAEETKAPGFELAMSSFILIAVAYLLRKL
jgi:cell division septation protein DedD